MPFKDEITMKRSINAVEQRVGSGEWGRFVLIWVCEQGPRCGSKKYCAIGAAASAMGASDEMLINVPAHLTPISIAQEYLGLSEYETEKINIRNDANGPEAAIRAMCEIGFEK